MTGFGKPHACGPGIGWGFAGASAPNARFSRPPSDPACEHFMSRTAGQPHPGPPAVNTRGLGRWRPYAEWLQPLIAKLAPAGVVLLQPASILSSTAGLRHRDANAAVDQP